MRDKNDQIINFDVDDVFNGRSYSSSNCILHMRDNNSKNGEIIVFPKSQHVMIRRLARVLEESFTAEDRRKLCGFDLFHFQMGRGGHLLRIDDYACIDLVPGPPDFRFTFSTLNGKQVLLVTTDARVMADFVRQYLLARVELEVQL